MCQSPNRPAGSPFIQGIGDDATYADIVPAAGMNSQLPPDHTALLSMRMEGYASQ